MFKEYLQIAKTYVAEQKSQLVIFGIVAGISLAVAVAVNGNGDLTQAAEAVVRRHR